MKSKLHLGFAMLALVITLGSCEKKETEPDTTIPVINQLMEGNKRYQEAHPLHPDQTKFRRQSTAEKQNPKAIVVSCSDSRVPPEIIFDQGLGNLFVIRTAGNIIGNIEMASIEYAVLKLNCKTIVVLGHEHCGAIQSFLDHPSDSLPGHLNELVNFIRSQPIQQKILEHQGDKSYEAVINNIIYFVGQLKTKSRITKEKFDKKEVEIFGAIYHLDNGKVQIIQDDIKK
jgi:carbonic anhydrase